MDRRTLYLHVGPHKTGTTYLQKLFTAGREKLAVQGVLYPEPADGAAGHHALAHELLQAPGDEAARLQGVVGEFPGDALLSSENFSRLETEQLRWFRTTFPDHAVKVIHFVRGRGSTLYSLWQEEVKHGADTGLPEYVARVLCRPYGNQVINPALLLDTYEPVVDDFVIVVYDNVLHAGGDIFDVFVDRCLARQTPDGLPHPGRVNRSLDPVRIEIIRLLNYVHLGRGGDRNHLLRDRFLEAARSIQEVAEFVDGARSALEGRARSLPLDALGAVFLHLDRALVRRAGEHVVNAAEDALFSAQSERSYEYFAPEEALERLGGWAEIEGLYAAVS